LIRHPAQHLFLQSLVDYAGVFPPAALELPKALAQYRQYQQGPHASLLGRLVLKAEQLSELLPQLHPQDRLRLTLILSDSSQIQEIDHFHQQAPASVRADSLEMRWNGDLPAWNYWLFLEVTPENWDQAAARAGGRVGLKLRTGGLSAEAFPESRILADFLRLVHHKQIIYKFTAGLHHAWPGCYPVSYQPNCAQVAMHGFLPLFGLACLHWAGQLDDQELLEGLNQPPPIFADQRGLVVGAKVVGPNRIEEYRRWGGQSFGSCSFEEPCQDLLERGWIC
jgi:hypothetical protein